MGSTIVKMTKAKNQLEDLKKDLKKYYNEIMNAKVALNAMMNGNGTHSYWQGEAAVQWYTNAIRKINKMMGNYARSYREFSDYAKVLDKAETKRTLKGANKQAIKRMVERADGKKYTNGVIENMEKERISETLPVTVSSDAVNDDQTKESYQQYNKLKLALENLERVADTMINDWNNVANNTTGKMNTDAKNRVTYMGDRKKEIISCRNNLEESYIGDILFS